MGDRGKQVLIGGALRKCSVGSKLKRDEEINDIIKALPKSSHGAGAETNDTETPTQSSVFVSSGGAVVAGRLSFLENGRMVDCSKMGSMGFSIPREIKTITCIQSDALFILLVEKDFSFHYLVTKEFYDRFPCILVTVEMLTDQDEEDHQETEPNPFTCSFLSMLVMNLNLPVLALIHSKPDCLKKLSFYGRDHNIKWLGIRFKDMDNHNIPKQCTTSMSIEDVNTCESLLKDEDFKKHNPGWVEELKLMLDMKKYVVIDALDTISWEYLTEYYLPFKLQEQDWI